MNRYTYDEISVGHSEVFQATVTDEMMSGFLNITGDVNPLHTDDEFAIKSSGGKFSGKAAYGMLTASFMSTLAGVYLPGENSLIHKVEAEFPLPVYVGDKLTFTGIVANKNDNFNTIELKVTAVNDEGKKVLRGKMRVEVLR